MRWLVTRECRCLSWPARLLLMAVLLAVALYALRHLHGFLAPVAPLGGDYLVVEGWLGDHALQAASERARTGAYRKVLVVGTQPYRGTLLDARPTHAEYAQAALRRLGVADDRLVLIRRPEVVRDRTYHAALGVRDWFRDAGIARPRFDLASEATHTARSQLLYRLAFGAHADIGVIALPRADYDANRWWASSAGLRAVLTEALGWLYVRIAFRP